MLRNVALLAVAVTGLLTLPSAALAGSSSISASSGALRWDVRGEARFSSAKVSQPNFAGCPGACLRLRLQDGTVDGTVDGCTVSFGTAACDEAAFGRVEMVGDGSGAFEITTTPGATSRDFTCFTGVEVITQQGGDGGTATRDSCRQEITCTDSYEGRVDADSLDVVADACRWLVVDGVEVRRRPKQAPPTSPTTPAPVAPPAGPAAPPSAPMGPLPMSPPSQPTKPAGSDQSPAKRPSAKKPSVLRSVNVRVSRRRSLLVRVRVRSSVRATIRVERRVKGRWKLAARRSVSARRSGTITRRLPGRGRLRPGRYRVRVTARASRYALVSSSLRVR